MKIIYMLGMASAYPSDPEMLLLETAADIKLLKPSFLGKIFHKQAFKGAILADPRLKALAQGFDLQAAGFDTLSYEQNGGKKRRTVSAICEQGIVGTVEFKLNGCPVKNPKMAECLPYLQRVFNEFADIVTPYFGREYKIRLEDRTGRYQFHSDEDMMVGSLGLDTNQTATLLRTIDGRVVQPEAGSMAIVLPGKIHSSPDVQDRPVLTAQKYWPR